MFGLSDQTLTCLNDYFKARPAIHQVRVYGSRALGTYHKGSDIDLAIFTSEPDDISGKVKTELDALSLPYLFDVTDYNHIQHHPLKEHIDRVSKLFYQQD